MGQPFVDTEIQHYYVESDPSNPPPPPDPKKKNTAFKAQIGSQEGAKTRTEYKKYIDKLVAIKERIRRECPPLIRLKMMVLDCRELNDMLFSACQTCLDVLKDSLITKINERNQNFIARFEFIDERIERRPTTEEALVEVES